MRELPKNPRLFEILGTITNIAKTREKSPKWQPLASKTIANMMGEFLKKINMREVNSGKHEFKQIHGFHKFFKTNAEHTCKTIDVEKLMGPTDNYYKPSMNYLLVEYYQDYFILDNIRDS